MPALAMCALGVPFTLDLWADPARAIDLTGHWLQMRRVHALANTAQMIKLQSRRNRTNKQFVDHAVRAARCSVDPE